MIHRLVRLVRTIPALGAVLALCAAVGSAVPAMAGDNGGGDPHLIRRKVAPPSVTETREPPPGARTEPVPPGHAPPEWAKVKPLYDRQREGGPDSAAVQAERDERLRADIERGMKLALFINSDKVRVQVRNGRVTLTGKVFSWVERGAAERIAYGSGAESVRNYLSVTFGPAFDGR